MHGQHVQAWDTPFLEADITQFGMQANMVMISRWICVAGIIDQWASV